MDSPDYIVNIGLVTEDEGPKPDKRFATINPKEFVERYIQTSFQGVDSHGQPRLEHMWVLVTGVVDATTVQGLMENDPVLARVPKYGESVKVALTAINKVMPELEGDYAPSSIVPDLIDS